MAVTNRRPDHLVPSPGREVLKLTSRLVKRKVAEKLPAPGQALSALTERAGTNGNHETNDRPLAFAGRLRSYPIQCSIDIAVPLELAYEEWMKLEFLPEGAHRVERITRNGNRLKGHIGGMRRQHSRWRAEIREERPYESFAWRSVIGSDCLGWLTFHRLAERLTRLELELDVVPLTAPEAFELLVHVADRRAEVDLRRFKAELERISPDDYPASIRQAGEDGQGDNDEEE